MEHNPLEAAKSVPIWVWLGVIVVVFIAISSHSASQTPTAAPVDSSADDAATALQNTALQAKTAIALRILDISGAEDIANIQARTTEQTNNTALAAIQTQTNAALAAMTAAQPPPPVNIVINKAANAQSFTRQSAVASSNVRKAQRNVLDGAAGAFSDTLAYGHGGL